MYIWQHLICKCPYENFIIELKEGVNMAKELLLSDVMVIAESIYQIELKKSQEIQSVNADSTNVNSARVQVINPSTHLTKLVLSHKKDMSTRAKEFFESMMDEMFFQDENMPKEWKPRTCSSAMESVAKILAHDDIKKTISPDTYEALVKRIDEKRKDYMNNYKRTQRAKAKATQDIEDDEDEELVGLNGPITREHASPLQLTGDEEVIEMDLGLIKSRISRTTEMLMKFTEHETDDFKRLYLDLIIEEMNRIATLFP